MEKVLYIGIHLLRLHLCHGKNFPIAYHGLLNSEIDLPLIISKFIVICGSYCESLSALSQEVSSSYLPSSVSCSVYTATNMLCRLITAFNDKGICKMTMLHLTNPFRLRL